MRKIISLITSVFLLLCGCNVNAEVPEKEKSVSPDISAVWVYYNELSMKGENGGTEESFTKKIEKIFTDCADMGINTVFVQVRPFSDAFYPSEIFPWSAYLTGTQGKSVDYDPLKIMVDIGHQKNMTVHAWINPFRVSADGNRDKLAKENPAFKCKDKNSVVETNGGIYFSPASEEAQKLVLDGVREIISNYDVDGIHIDDYFYPSTEEKVDKAYYDSYVKNGGELTLDEWRLNTVSAFVAQMYSTVKSLDSDCIFSVSPAGNINNNYTQQYADVKLWCSQRGFADWIIPQLYYGFESKSLTFDKACREWSELDTIGAVKMIYGIAAYKVNSDDGEWKAGNGIIDRQIECAKETGNCGGFAYFSYSQLADSKKSAEFKNIGKAVADATDLSAQD